MKQTFISCLQRISNILMINGGFLDNPGLYTGEMGLVLFFFRYARFTQNGLYSDYGFDMIKRVQIRINDETPIDYKQGISGIGSAFEYLVQTGFIKADTDVILDEFDKRIFSINHLSNFSIEDLLGIGYYALWRMSGFSVKKDAILKETLPQVVNFMEKIPNSALKEVAFFKTIVSAENRLDSQPWFHPVCKNSAYRLDSAMFIPLLDKFSKTDSSNKNTFSLGIHNGLAGLGLSLLTELDGDDSWTFLLCVNP